MVGEVPGGAAKPRRASAKKADAPAISDAYSAISANIKYKDTVFTELFSDPAVALSLYNTLFGANLADSGAIRHNTIGRTLINGKYNDVSFEADQQFIILIEHQSSINQNMPIRCLLYAARIYENMLRNSNIYGSASIKLPAPEFCVLYNGLEKWLEDGTIRLSDSYLAPGAQHGLDVSVRVLDINYDSDKAIFKEDSALRQYALFVSCARHFERTEPDRVAAMRKTVEHCIRNGILQKFLERRGSELSEMAFEEITLEQSLKNAWEGGEREGKLEGAERIVQLIRGGVPLDEAIKMVKMELEQ
jgi:hypothetical protein